MICSSSYSYRIQTHALPSITVAARCRWGLVSGVRRMHFHHPSMTFAFRNSPSKLGFSLPISLIYLKIWLQKDLCSDGSRQNIQDTLHQAFTFRYILCPFL